MKTVDYFARLRSQLTSFLFINGDGLTVSRLGLSITLFFKQGYTQEKKQCILACYRRFREEFGTHLRFHRHELKGLKKYSPENIAKNDLAFNTRSGKYNGVNNAKYSRRKKIILKGDTTTTGGDVLNGSGLVNQQLAVARKGDPVFCPACKQTGAIAEGSNLFNIQGIPVALEGHRVNCGCSTGACRLKVRS